jgi:transcriptional regulator with XRE-family HTH domain
MRRSSRLKKERASNRLFLVSAPKEYERALQNVDRYIFGIVDMQLCGETGRAGNVKQVEHIARLFRARFHKNQGSQCLEELPFFVFEHIGFRLERSHHYFLLQLFYLLPLNSACSLLRGQFGGTKSDTIRAPKETMETFGEWLQHQRSLRRLTREEFAKRVGCSVSALRKIEYGERRPSTQIAELMANCLNVPLEERSTFVRVARGELRVDRLPLESKSYITPGISPKINLPLFPTPLIGREHEVEQLSQLLRDPQCRLLSLVGPGGIGKTRLAIETAAQVQDVFPDDVFFVPLASAHSSRLIVPVIADSVGFAF